MGRHVSVCHVAGGDDMELCGVNIVLSGAVSGGLCDKVSRGGDTNVSDVDTVVLILPWCHDVTYSCEC